MQSNKKRYPKGSDEANRILKVTAEEGRGPGQEYAGIKDYLAWCRWLEYATGNPNFGICPTNPKEVRSDSELLRAKAHNAFGKLLSALDDIAEGERQKLLVEKELRLFIWKYMEAKRELCEVTL